MALKRKLTKAEFDALADVLKEHYKASGADYVLDATGDDPAFAALKAEKQSLADKIAESERKAQEAADEAARKSGDITALEASWRTKHENDTKALKDQVSKLSASLHNSHVTAVATGLAGKISTVPSLVAPLLAKRLKVEFDGDNAITRVLDKDGKASALSLDDLSNEFVANPEFKAIMIASKAKGGGAPVKPASGGGAPQGDGSTKVDLTKLSGAELAAAVKQRRESRQQQSE